MQNQGCQAKIISRQSFSDHRSSFVQHAISTHLEILKQHAINRNKRESNGNGEKNASCNLIDNKILNKIWLIKKKD